MANSRIIETKDIKKTLIVKALLLPNQPRNGAKVVVQIQLHTIAQYM